MNVPCRVLLTTVLVRPRYGAVVGGQQWVKLVDLPEIPRVGFLAQLGGDDFTHEAVRINWNHGDGRYHVHLFSVIGVSPEGMSQYHQDLREAGWVEDVSKDAPDDGDDDETSRPSPSVN